MPPSPLNAGDLPDPQSAKQNFPAGGEPPYDPAAFEGVWQRIMAGRELDTRRDRPPQEVSTYHPSQREQLEAGLMGDAPSPQRRRLVKEGVTALDWLTPLGNAWGVQEAIGRGDPQGAAMSMVPAEGGVLGRTAHRAAHAVERAAHEAGSEARADELPELRPPRDRRADKHSALSPGDLPPDPYYDPLSATAGVSPPGTPRVDQIDWGRPSWAQQAGEQSERDRAAFAKGGAREMLKDTEGAQDLAGGFSDAGIAGLTKRAAAITATSLRHMPMHEAIAVAESGAHVIPKKDGGFIGAPYWVRTTADLEQMRRNFDAQVERGLTGAPWYGEAQAGIKETAGPDPARQHLQAREQALFSAQSDPDVNLGFTLAAHNAFEMGQPLSKAHTGRQASTYRAARESGEDIKLGKKTGIYAEHLDPTMEDPTTGTNDIWHARAFDYRTPEGKPWDRALTPQQHAFLDAETVLAVARANKRNLGGRSNWTPGEIQAAPWVAGKSEGLQRKRGLSKEAADTEAAKTYPAHYDKYTAHGTYEATPGIGTGHMENVATGPEALRAEYGASPLSQWMDPQGRDILYDTLGAYQRKTKPATGVFQSHEGPLETNPANVARPLVGLKGTSGKRAIDPASRKMLTVAEAVRAYVDAQNMGAFSKPIRGNQVGRSNSFLVPHDRPMTIEQVQQLRELGASVGLPHVIDYGEGVVLTDFAGQQDSKALTRVLKDPAFQEKLKGILPGVPQRVELDAGAIDYEGAFKKPGSGEATRLLREHVLYDEVLNKLDASPELRQAALDRFNRDLEKSAQGGGIAREDIQRARMLIATTGFRGLFAALDAGVALPAALLPIAVGAVAASQKGE